MKRYKLVVYVPLNHADAVRQALGDAGAGRIGNYDYCSFSTRGQGRYRGGEGSTPFIGQAGQLEMAEEERIEVTVDAKVLQTVTAAMRAVHPYEEVAFDVWELVNLT